MARSHPTHDNRAMSTICHDAQCGTSRIVDVLENLMKFTLLTRDVSPYLVDRYSERKESAEALMKRVNQAATA